MVESECGAVAVGRTYLLPPLSFGGALLVRPWLRFHIPLIEPDMQISRIRLSDKISRLRPRHVVPRHVQAYEPEVPVQVRECIAPAFAPPPDLMLGAQPPTQPHCRVIVERSISRAHGAYLEVVRPSAQRAVQLSHQHCGLLPCPPRRVAGALGLYGGSPIADRRVLPGGGKPPHLYVEGAPRLT